MLGRLQIGASPSAWLKDGKANLGIQSIVPPVVPGTSRKKNEWVKVEQGDSAYFWNRTKNHVSWDLPDGARPKYYQKRDAANEIYFVCAKTGVEMQSLPPLPRGDLDGLSWYKLNLTKSYTHVDYCLRFVDHNNERLVCFFLDRGMMSQEPASKSKEISRHVFGDAACLECDGSSVLLGPLPPWMSTLRHQLVKVKSRKWLGLRAIGMAHTGKALERANRLAISVAALAQDPSIVLPQYLRCDVLRDLISQVREELSSEAERISTPCDVPRDRSSQEEDRLRSSAEGRSKSVSRKANKQPKPPLEDVDLSIDSDQKATSKTSVMQDDIDTSLSTPVLTSTQEKQREDGKLFASAHKKDRVLLPHTPNNATASTQDELHDHVSATQTSQCGVWKRYKMEDQEDYWWWCELDNDCFLESSPGLWERYKDPNTGRGYWWKSDECKAFWI